MLSGKLPHSSPMLGATTVTIAPGALLSIAESFSSPYVSRAYQQYAQSIQLQEDGKKMVAFRGFSRSRQLIFDGSCFAHDTNLNPIVPDCKISESFSIISLLAVLAQQGIQLSQDRWFIQVLFIFFIQIDNHSCLRRYANYIVHKLFRSVRSLQHKAGRNHWGNRSCAGRSHHRLVHALPAQAPVW